MNITVIHGSERKGSTYNIARLFTNHLREEDDWLREFFLPRDMEKFCIGCCNCFARGEQFCPHFAQTEPICKAIRDADFVIFTTPVYAMRASGQMKALLDHFAYLFMTHRPMPEMFSKAALVISTGAGGGTKPAIKDIAISLRFWGVAKTYRYGKAVFASEWNGVSDKMKRRIEKDVAALSGKIRKRAGREKPGMRTRLLFYLFRLFHRKFGFCPYDVAYWQENGWLQRRRPWR